MLRVVEAIIGGNSTRKTIKFKAAGNSSNLDPEEITAVQRSMENTANGDALDAQMMTQEFKGKYPFLGGFEKPFVKFEQFRTSTVGGGEEARKSDYAANFRIMGTAALVTPMYPGRLASTNEIALSLTKTLGIVGRATYDSLIQGKALELDADELRTLEQRITVVPLELVSLSAALTIALKANGGDSLSRDDRKQSRKDSTRKRSNGRNILVDLATPQITPKSTPRSAKKAKPLKDDFTGKGELTKRGVPKRKQGRKEGTTVLKGKVTGPMSADGRTKLNKAASVQRMADSALNCTRCNDNASLRERVAALELLLIQQKEINAAIQTEKMEMSTEFRVKEANYTAELGKRSAIAHIMATTASQQLPAGVFTDISPMKFRK